MNLKGALYVVMAILSSPEHPVNVSVIEPVMVIEGVEKVR